MANSMLAGEDISQEGDDHHTLLAVIEVEEEVQEQARMYPREEEFTARNFAAFATTQGALRVSSSCTPFPSVPG